MENYKICPCCLGELDNIGFAQHVYIALCYEYAQDQSVFMTYELKSGTVFRFLERKGYVTTSECRLGDILIVRPNTYKDSYLFCRGHKKEQISNH